jgi:dephospho-CoA kinase
MKVIGLTGGIGAGKSVVAGAWQRLGARVLEADHYGHRVLAEHVGARRALQRQFGDDVIDRHGRVDRDKIAERAFATPGTLRELNRIVGGPLVKMLHADIARLRRRRGGVLVVDAALICEWSSTVSYDLRVLVTAPRRAKLRWLSQRGLPYRQAAERMRSQWTDARKRAWADVEIRNDGSVADLRRKARRVWREHVESR